MQPCSRMTGICTTNPRLRCPGSVCLSCTHTRPANPTSHCQSLWVRLAHGAPSGCRPICHLCFAKLAISCVLIVSRLMLGELRLLLLCSYFQREGHAVKDGITCLFVNTQRRIWWPKYKFCTTSVNCHSTFVFKEWLCFGFLQSVCPESLKTVVMKMTMRGCFLTTASDLQPMAPFCYVNLLNLYIILTIWKFWFCVF